jgi:hypothetical protein
VSDGFKKLATGYVSQGVLLIGGALGMSFSTQQQDKISAVSGGIVSALALLLPLVLNFYSTRKKTETAVDARTLSILGAITPAIQALLERKDAQVADPKQKDPTPLIQQVGVPPGAVVKAAEKIVRKEGVADGS